MNRPLERQLIVRSHARESWDRRVHGFKVCKVEWVLQALHFLAQVGAIPRRFLLDTVSRTPLNLRQCEVIGYIVDRLDAQLFQFLHHAGVDSWQGCNVVLRAQWIASVEKFASDGLRAV